MCFLNKRKDKNQGGNMQIEAVRTTNHEEIMRWIKDRHGVVGRIHEEETSGLGSLFVYFPNHGEQPENFEELTKNEFLKVFEDQKLVFIYQEILPEGGRSRFYAFARR
ncbi:MAG: hypothetical protein ACK4ND_18265 [Cytophagaceae bacterium]